jgi:hypothetical protein
MQFRSTHRITILSALFLTILSTTIWAQTIECGNAFYDDGDSVGWTWFGGGMAGRPDYMYAVRFDLADFEYEPGQVEIAGICAGNLVSAGGLYPNEIFVYADNEGTPDDSVVLAQGMILTGNGTGESIVMFEEPVVLQGDFWLVNRGYAPFKTSDFNMEYDVEPDSGHSFVSSEGLDNLAESTDGDWILRAYLQPTDRTYLVAGVAHIPGDRGTEWRSKLGLLNTTDEMANASISYIRSDDTSSQEVVVAPGELVAWDDIAVNLFGLEEPTSGSVRVDSNHQLVVTNRTYNQLEEGTVGQFLPGLLASEGLTDADVGILSQLASNSAFRTNIGFTNFSDKQCSISVNLFDTFGAQVGEEQTLTVAPSRWKQLNDVFGRAGAGEQDNAYARVRVLNGNCSVWSYASVVDQVTGDPTTVPVVIE